MEKFIVGLVVGGAIGALLVANNHKMRTLVKKAQEETQAKMDAFMDEKINAMETCAKKTAEQAEEKMEEVFEPIQEQTGKKGKKNKK